MIDQIGRGPELIETGGQVWVPSLGRWVPRSEYDFAVIGSIGTAVQRCLPGKHLPFDKPLNYVDGAARRGDCVRPHCPHCLFHLDETRA